MVDDTIHFEQKLFLREISNGLDLTNVRSWFQHVEPGSTVQAPQSSESRLSAFTRSTIDLIVSGCGSVPPTFRFDVDRIAALQVEFDLSQKQATCAQVFIETLTALGCSGQPPIPVYKNLLYRISAVADYPRTNCDQLEAFTEIALEIVRAAYELTGNERFPEENLVEATANKLLYAWSDETEEFQAIQSILRDRLARSVDEGMAAIVDKTPLQILNYFDPVPLHPRPITPFDPARDMRNAADNLQSVADRIAHIATLHWRAWGPILYEQPRRASAAMHSLDVSPDGEVDLAPAASMLMSEQESRDKIMKSGPPNSDGSSSDRGQSSPV